MSAKLRIGAAALGIAGALAIVTTSGGQGGPSPNLLINRAFDTDTDGWENGPTWDPHQSPGTSNSGIARIAATSNGPTGGGQAAWQCVPVESGAYYVFAASAWVPLNQLRGANAQVYLEEYASADCTGGPIPRPGSPLIFVLPGSDWVNVTRLQRVSAATMSVRFYFETVWESVKNPGEPNVATVEAFFDNLSLAEATARAFIPGISRE